jgi:outer membrane protein
VGVINFQGAIMGTKDGQKAAAQLEQQFSPKQKDFQARQAEIAQLEDQLNKGGNLMSEDKRSQTVRDIDEKKRRLQRDAEDARQELDQAQQKALNEIYQRMMAVLTKYAKDNGFTLILDDGNQQTSPILFASSGIDVTQDIISLYDKSSSKGGPISVPAAPGSATRPSSTTTPPAPGTK